MAAHGADRMERARMRCAFRARARGALRARGTSCTRSTASRAMRAVSTRAPSAPDTRRGAAPSAANELRAIRTLRAVARKVRTVSTVHRHKISAITARNAFEIATRPELATEHTATEVTLRSGRAGLARQNCNHQIFDFECHKATPGKGVLWA